MMENVSPILAPNRALMLQHLEFLFGRALSGRIEITGLRQEPGQRAQTRTRFFGVDELQEAVDYAADLNAEPQWNAYVGAALRREDVFPGSAADDDDFHRAYALWADADDENQVASAREVYRDRGVTPPMVVVTGRVPTKRAQFWWPLEDPIDDIQVLRAALRGIAAALKTDPKVCTGKQLMRLAGGVNWPKKEDRILERTEVVMVDRAAREFPIEQVARAFPPLERAEFRGEVADVVIQQGGALGLEEKIMDGREGYAFELVTAHLHEWIGTTGSEPTPDELYASVAPVYFRKTDQERGGRGASFLKQKCIDRLRAFQAGQIPFMRDLEHGAQTWSERNRAQPVAGPQADSPAAVEATPAPRLISGAQFAGREMKPRPWFVPDMIPGAQVTTLDGDGGLGKSTLGLQVCVAAATGRSWLGQAVQRGPTIYLASEDDEDELHRRLDSLCVHYGVSAEDLGDMHVWPLAECDPALVTATRDDRVEPTGRWRELEGFIEKIKPVAIVLDSRADVFGGNEISRSQARGFIGMLRSLAVRRGLTVLMLAHPSLSGMSSGTGSSGSTHWRNSVRAALYLTRPAEPEEGAPVDPDARVLEVKKSNYGPSGLVLNLRWSVGAFVLADGDRIASPVDRGAQQAVVDAAFLRMLAMYGAQGRFVSDRPGHSYAPAAFAKDPASGGIAKGGFAASMNRLFAAGTIGVELAGPPSKQVRKLVRKFDGDAT